MEEEYTVEDVAMSLINGQRKQAKKQFLESDITMEELEESGFLSISSVVSFASSIIEDLKGK